MSDTTGPDILEKLSQRISSAYFNVGPKLTMTDVAEVLAEVRTLRDEVTRLREENEAVRAENTLMNISVAHLKAKLDEAHRQKTRQMT